MTQTCKEKKENMIETKNAVLFVNPSSIGSFAAVVI